MSYKKLILSKFKNYFKKPYFKVINLIARDLKTPEIEHKQNHIIEEINNIKASQKELLELIKVNNLLIGGGQTLGDDFLSSDQVVIETNELMQIFLNKKKQDIFAINWINKLNENYFINKSTLLIKSSQIDFGHILKSKKIKRFLSITLTNSTQNEKFLHNINIYPTNIKTLSIEQFNTLIIFDPISSSLLLKHNLFEIGSKIKDFAVIRLNINPTTIFKNKFFKPYVYENNQVVYDDNFARKLLHESGFVEVESNYKGYKKVSRLNYKNGFEIISKASNKKITNSDFETITYVGYKLPQTNTK